MKIKTLCVFFLITFVSCQSSKICRSTAPEEAAVIYLVDSILPNRLGDKAKIYIDLSIGISEISFFYDICPFYPKNDSIWEYAYSENLDSLIVYDCRKGKKKYSLSSRLKNIPSKVIRTTWKQFASRINGKGRFLIQLFHFSRKNNNKYYVYISNYNDSQYLLILDENYKVIECRFKIKTSQQ